ncbi:hypothetical protein [Mycobacterium sp.]|uniref:hypothetical protein n=1 Tax=Mycobacterium sp. TaxID=1785 RepID=UPI003A85D1BD
MASRTQNRVLTTSFGLLMVISVTVGAQGIAQVCGAAAAIAVGLGAAFRPMAPVAVALTVPVIAVTQPAPVPAALAGLCAAACLMCGYLPVEMVSGPTLVAAVGFTVAGLLAASFPVHLPWAPLVAPPAVLAIYVLATRAFMS